MFGRRDIGRAMARPAFGWPVAGGPARISLVMPIHSTDMQIMDIPGIANSKDRRRSPRRRFFTLQAPGREGRGNLGGRMLCALSQLDKKFVSQTLFELR